MVDHNIYYWWLTTLRSSRNSMLLANSGHSLPLTNTSKTLKGRSWKENCKLSEEAEKSSLKAKLFNLRPNTRIIWKMTAESLKNTKGENKEQPKKKRKLLNLILKRKGKGFWMKGMRMIILTKNIGWLKKNFCTCKQGAKWVTTMKKEGWPNLKWRKRPSSIFWKKADKENSTTLKGLSN